MNYTHINEQFKEKFLANRNQENLEKYAMSELLPLIEDYGNYIKIIKGNLDIITNLNLIYIAVEASSMIEPDNSFLIEYLMSKIEHVGNIDKSIIYYLNALYIENNDKDYKKSNLYKELLIKSVELSKNFKFVNNRVALSKILNGEKQKQLIAEAYENIEHAFDPKIITHDTLEDLLNCENYINEFILGTYRSKSHIF